MVKVGDCYFDFFSRSSETFPQPLRSAGRENFVTLRADRNSQTPTLKKFRADWVFFEHRASDRDLIDRIPKKSAKGTLAGTPLVLYIYI